MAQSGTRSSPGYR